MKNLLRLLSLIAVLGLITAGLSYYTCCDEKLHAAAQRRDAHSWLCAEFKLSAAQVARIEAMHEDYRQECQVHCEAIMEATEALEKLEESGKATPQELAAAKALVESRTLTCRNAIRVHLAKVAALMPPEEGKRYLELLMPRVEAYQHKGAPNLGMEP